MTKTRSPSVRRPRFVLFTLAMTGIIVSLQQTLILPLLPELPRLLGTTSDNTSWLVTATLLAGGIATPTVSRLADMFGKKRMMLVALGVMVIGSVLGAATHDFALVVVARTLQGVGMALIPVGIAIMRDELPREKIPMGVAMMSATLAIGAGVGPPLAGLLSEHLDWHSIFWVTAAVGALLVIGVALVVPESPMRSGGSFDFGGALILSLALAAVLLAVSKGGDWGWTSPMTLSIAIAGTVLLLLWIPVELKVSRPIIDIRVAVRPAILLVNAVSVLMGFAMFANLLVTTQLLQRPTSVDDGQGLTVLATGLWVAPVGLAFGVMAPVSAVITRRFGALTTLLCGSIAMTVVYVARGFFSHELWQIVAGSILVASGTSMAFAAMPVLILRAAPASESASANGLNMLCRTLGTSSSSALTAAVAAVGAVHVGGGVVARHGTLMAVFFLAAAMTATSCALVLPMWRMRRQYRDAQPPPSDEVPGEALVGPGSAEDRHGEYTA